MLNITIVCVGNLKESYLREAEAEYKKRLTAYASLKIIELKDSDPIIPHLPKKAYKIALCVEGKEISSEQLSEILSDVPVRGYSEVCFIIGSSYGMSAEVKARADLRLSVSKLTFPHQLMRVLLLEAIYRAFNIRKGTRYHK